ncbi:hypothetical protein AKJ60_00475 [candidate division MSBL1 archaeon SCGC-AAA385M11]|nr:hypothetical protein AKJ60_00475 [candidate division MSBL1 archaeon SCGC-AAA385M11]
MLGIDQDRPVVLVGAQYMDSFYKGFADYLQALEYLDSDVFLLFFGKLDQKATAVKFMFRGRVAHRRGASVKPPKGPRFNRACPGPRTQ